MIKFSKMTNNPIINMMKSSLIYLPTPSNISYFWNFGSILGICLITQILTGLFLAMHYTPHTDLAFQSVIHICRDVNGGWMLRTIHSNGASMFFVCLYIHIGRGLYFESFMMTNTWNLGVTIFLVTMATAFMGYVLPWGQMSFWGATVITNLLSAIPYLGQTMVKWVWGGFSVDNPTLNRFFVFHFVLPFVIILLVLFHLTFLHESGSSNPLGMNNVDKMTFHPYFTWKDLIGFMIFFYILLTLMYFMPYYLGDPDNFLIANPMVTPIHIKPEWYFLFAYAILRSIPNKLGGVIALGMSIMILYLLPLMYNVKIKGTQFNILLKVMFWTLISIFLLLTWVGGCPVEYPYIKISQVLTILYFLIFMLMPKTKELTYKTYK